MSEMQLKKIKYSDLNAKQKEIFNFQKLAARLADYGYNCIKLTDDWQGADFLAYHKSGKKTLKIQLKARITINKKYEDKSLFVAFPARKDNDHVRGRYEQEEKEKDWYVIKHNDLLTLVGKGTNWLDSKDWNRRGLYSADEPSKKLRKMLERYKL